MQSPPQRGLTQPHHQYLTPSSQPHHQYLTPSSQLHHQHLTPSSQLHHCTLTTPSFQIVPLIPTFPSPSLCCILQVSFPTQSTQACLNHPLPYGHSNSYPMPRMVTQPRQMLPHTAAKSPPYRQYQEQPPALFPSPPVLMDQQSMQTQYTNPGLPNRQMSAPASYPTETQQPARKRKRNREKTQQQNT